MHADESGPVTPVDPDQPSRESKESDPVRRMLTELAALREYAAHLAAAQVDMARVRVRSLCFSIALRIALTLLGLVLAIVCSIHLVRGVAGGLSAAFGGRVWLGDLLAGMAGLGTLAGLAALSVGRMRERRRKLALDRYEKRRAGQRARVGHDVEEAACGVV